MKLKIGKNISSRKTYGYTLTFMLRGFKIISLNFFKSEGFNRILLEEWKESEIKQDCSPNDKVFIIFNWEKYNL